MYKMWNNYPRNLVLKLKQDWVNLKPYFIIISLLFLVSILFGMIFAELISKLFISLLETIVEQALTYTGFALIGFITLNNLRSALMSILLGPIAGIFPVFSAIINGLIIGAVLMLNLTNVWKIIPHGIFELPAIILAMAIGFKLGVNVFAGGLKNTSQLAIRWFFFVILPLLVIAGIIEGLLITFIG